MERYGKTLNIYKRDEDSHKLIVGEYVTPLIASLAALPIWHVTEKIDGTSMRLIFRRAYAGVDGRNTNGFLEVRGRGDNADVKNDLRDTMLGEDDYPLDRFNTVWPDDDNGLTVCVYGEGYGAGIQKGAQYGALKRFAAFALKVNGRWVPPEESFPIFDRLGIEAVPVLDIDSLSQAAYTVTRGERSSISAGYAEGLVAVPYMGLLDQWGKAIRIKIKHKELYR